MNTQVPIEVIGVGFGLANLDGTVTIVYVVPDTSAFRAGLSPGFFVHKIDGVLTKGMRQHEWHQKLRGDAGTKVRIEVANPVNNQATVVELVRESFILPTVLPTSAVLRT